MQGYKKVQFLAKISLCIQNYRR